MEIVGGINKKGDIFGLESQVSLEKVAPMEAKNEALIMDELEKKNCEQEMIKQKMEHLNQMFGNFVSNMSSIQAEGEGDNSNDEIDEI
ncbi:hypothetical protein MTR_8g066845 [Medicago truncatula]|uniref:Uncharacterized protein n=1 Tax=Medicago truncatula TaxID=3880 RepID=A0A072TS88_MEDTR|nr:hypothetical protein MTR_8g066845 [Medicago truncatula]